MDIVKNWKELSVLAKIAFQRANVLTQTKLFFTLSVNMYRGGHVEILFPAGERMPRSPLRVLFNLQCKLFPDDGGEGTVNICSSAPAKPGRV